MLQWRYCWPPFQRVQTGNVKGPQQPVRHADNAILRLGWHLSDFPDRLWKDAEKVALLTRPTPARRDVPVPVRRSRIVQTLNVPKEILGDGNHGGAFPFAKIHSTGERPTRSAVCTSLALHSLRPCWTNFLSILRGRVLLCQTCEPMDFLRACIVVPQPAGGRT